MKMHWYNSDLHIGTQPVRVFSINISQWYVNSYPDFICDLKDEISYHDLKKHINYLTGENPIQKVAFVDDNKTITIEETFLSFLWIIGYSIFVLYDEVVTKPVIKDWAFSPRVFKYITDSEKLLDYGLSLTKSFSKWDIENLPNPEYYDKTEDEYIEKINNVFLSAVNFILIHEFSHVYLGHLDLDNDNHINEQVFSNQELIKQELAADRYAIDSLLMSRFEKTNIHVIKAGILIGLTALIFFDNSMKGEVHPDPDERIKIALESMNLSWDDNLWGVANMGFKQWSKYYNIDLHWPLKIENYQQLFYHNIDRLNDYKRMQFH